MRKQNVLTLELIDSTGGEFDDISDGERSMLIRGKRSSSAMSTIIFAK